MRNISTRTWGFIYATAAFGVWGLVPLFWILLKSIPPLQILAHRILWSFVFFLVLFWVRGQGRQLALLFSSKRTLLSNLPNAWLIGSNWGIYIYAVNSGHAVESSLGYFINPILNVMVGAFVFKEKIPRNLWVAFGFVVLGLFLMSAGQNRFPWIAVLLASTFCIYGILKKKSQITSLESIAVECGLLLPFALFVLFSSGVSRVDIWGMADGPFLSALISVGGALTALPLIWFTEAAKRIPFSTLGFFQYLSPMLQLAIAVFVFKESINSGKILALSFVWMGLLIYIFDSIHRSGINLNKLLGREDRA